MPVAQHPPRYRGRRRRTLLLLALCTLALLPRLESARELGRDWYFPGSFTLVNFDEGGSCRAALRGFSYSPFVGWQTIALASLAGAAPPPDAAGDARAAKRYCHGAAHIGAARGWSALLGALTVGVTVLLGWQLYPGRPAIGLLGGTLLGLSGWHISASHSATVDAASVFFIHLFLLGVALALRYGGVARWLGAAALLVPALWAKYWVFALLGMVAVLPRGAFARGLAGVTRTRLLVLLLAFSLLFGVVCNPALPPALRPWLPPLFYLFAPWRRLSPAGRVALLLLPWLAPLAMQWDLFAAYSAGSPESRFGSGYGAIGWHKPLRNAVNLPLVLAVGLGLPGFLLLLHGLQHQWRAPAPGRGWLALVPLAAFALYMLCLAPVTYYRHYLPLLPLACLFAAAGWAALPARTRRLLLAPLLLWQALLAWDLVSDFHRDPRRALPDWYAQQQPRRVLVSFYVNPPARVGVSHELFLPGTARDPAELLATADALLLSENWYDTAFANELNGPRVGDLRRLVKTTPVAARFYRRALADRHPLVTVERRLRAPSFMPELLLHRRFYGSFTLFVGDLVILRPRPRADLPR